MYKKVSLQILLPIIIITFAGAFSAIAAPLGAFTPAEDAYVYRLSPTTNYDGQLLHIEQDAGIGGGTVPQNRVAFVKFDLLGQTEEITTASFSLAPVTGTSCVGSWNTTTTLDVYGVSVDSWAEGTITWDSATTDGMMDSANLTSLGTATLDASTGYYTLIHPDLVAWLETERTGDATATFLVQLSAGQAGESAFFEDSELTATGVGDPPCAVPSPAQPLIDLGSAPLAVTISDMGSGSSDQSWVAWLGLVLVLMFVVGLTAVFQSKQKPQPIPIKFQKH